MLCERRNCILSYTYCILMKYLFFLYRQREQQEQILNHKLAGLMQTRLLLADKLKEIINKLGSLQSRILDDELIR